MRDYDQNKLREHSDSYNKAWEDLRQTQKALVSFWLIGNGAGAALSLNFLIQMATTPKTTLPVYALFPSGLFLLGLFFCVGFIGGSREGLPETIYGMGWASSWRANQPACDAAASNDRPALHIQHIVWRVSFHRSAVRRARYSVVDRCRV